jgi:hypothetical protein
MENPFQTETEQQAIQSKWNWGGFALTLYFAIAHRAWLGLLVLIGIIPILGQIFAFVWAIISGLNAEKWALENPDNHYRDNEEFRKVMDGWNRAGLVAFIVMIASIVISIIAFVIFFASLSAYYNQNQF